MSKKTTTSQPPSTSSPDRRGFLQATAATVAGGYFCATATPTLAAGPTKGFEDKNEQLGIGFIGTGIRYHTYLGAEAMRYGACVAVADADSLQAGRAVQVAYDQHRKHNRPLNVRAVEDYRKLLDRKDIDVVVIGSPDHWHTKMAIDAMRAGKDVYCEKPLTLTIREGQQIYKVMQETGRVFQVGTQQRSEFGLKFLKAAGIARENRIGKINDITVCLGGSRISGVLPVVEPPSSLNWEFWLGQCPVVDYREAAEIEDIQGWGAGHPFSRAHRYYRWFYEYSGGKLTDWGAHHVDVALWALDRLGEDAGKVTIDPMMVDHPVEFVDGMPTKDDQFNCAVKFKVGLGFEDGLNIVVADTAEDKGFKNGIMFEGEGGRYFVNRGKLTGKAAEGIEKNPLKEETLKSLYASGKIPEGYGEDNYGANMKNFMECVKTRETPSSDVLSHNRSMNLCHGINIAMRLGRKLTFDTKTEKFVGDDVANSFIQREQRAGYEIDA
jgi:predicted dehydrogenase